MTATEHVILVDENDHEIGTAEKLEAHRNSLRHRAFSVFIFHGKEILLQQRAADKYHCPLLWSNTCCSHPRPGETIMAAGERRLQEEMGIQATLSHRGWFHYIAHFANGLVENEIDHVLVGTIATKKINFNSQEVQATRWITLDELRKELVTFPEKFTPWLEMAMGLL